MREHGAMPSARNLFSIGRRRGAEDQLTEMLVWLAESVPDVGNALLTLAFGEGSPELEDIEITTQRAIVGGRLDALLTTRSTTLVVESKLSAEYGGDQIGKYVAWLAEQPRERRSLMTLTARHAPWPRGEESHARRLDVHPAVKRWEELYALLEPMAATEPEQDVQQQLIREFLDMLSEEGLIPMQPLSEEELGRAWRDSYQAIHHYWDFFRACTGEIAERIGASPASAWSGGIGGAWQDFLFEDQVLLAVGLHYTDEEELVVPSHSVIVWLAPRAEDEDRPDWPEVANRLEALPPDGWTVAAKRWYRRPYVWRPLLDVVGVGSFEEQKSRLADAATLGRAWFDSAVS
jgi:hypothetical protein